METWIIKIIEEFGYAGIFLLKVLENVFPPIPSEVILTFGGFMTTQTDLTVAGIITFSTLGSVGGAVINYGIGMLIGLERIEKIISRWGHILRLTNKDFHRANAWFEKYGIWTVFFCRFIPLIRSLISIPAGMARIHFGLFILLTSLGTIIWNITLISLGIWVGDSWETIVASMAIYSNAIYFILVVLVIGTLAYLLKRRKKEKDEKSRG